MVKIVSSLYLNETILLSDVLSIIGSYLQGMQLHSNPVLVFSVHWEDGDPLYLPSPSVIPVGKWEMPKWAMDHYPKKCKATFNILSLNVNSIPVCRWMDCKTWKTSP